MGTRKSSAGRQVILAGIFLAFAVVIALLPKWRGSTSGEGPAGPWAKEQIVQPGDLAAQLADSMNPNRPLVIYVGPGYLYRNAHIPGAVNTGAAGTAVGLEGLKKLARDVPRDKAVLLYCGCCPFSACPNVRPAFAALHSMGFTNLKVLFIPSDFGTDWVNKGYSIERGM